MIHPFHPGTLTGLGNTVGPFKRINGDNKEIVLNLYRDRFPKILGLNEGIKHFGPQIRILRQKLPI